VANYCVDASVVLAWLLEENYALVNDFWRSLTATDTIIAAQLLKPECASVIHESVSNRRISRDQAVTSILRLTALPVETNLDPVQFVRARELAERFRLGKAYDTQYLAVAELTGAELLTIDGGMRQRAVELKLPHRLLR
jgi:predicted nucleic acid-binding protein